MDTSGFFDDLLFIVKHIHGDSEAAVRRWTHVSCRDYQLPLALLTGMLADFGLTDWSGELKLRDTPVSQAISEIVKHSRLSVLLDVDGNGHRVAYRDEVSMALKEQVALFISNNTSAFT